MPLTETSASLFRLRSRVLDITCTTERRREFDDCTPKKWGRLNNCLTARRLSALSDGCETWGRAMADEITKDPRVFFAAERTFLAWIRTGIALMGFGFVVARFGLFLREIQAAQHVATESSPRFSLWIGIALIMVGVFVILSATFRQGRLIEHLRQGSWEVRGQSRVGVGIAILLSVIGSAMAVYLTILR